MPNNEQAAILLRGVGAWNLWRAQNAEERIDLRGIDVRPERIVGHSHLKAEVGRADLRGANLQGADLEGSQLENVDLREADLRGSNLKGARLFQANLGRADLRQANLEDAQLRDANLEHARLSGACLRRSELAGARFRKADLSDADLDEAGLKLAHLEEARCRRASFRRAQLVHAYLRDAELREAHLEEAVLSNARLEGVDLGAAHLNKAKLWDTNLKKANLTDACLADAELRSAKLNRAALVRADLRAAKLWGAHLQGAHLEKADLRRAELLGARLHRASLEKAILSDAELRNADLSGAVLLEAELLGTDLRDSNLEEAKLEGATLSGAALSAAAISRATDLRDIRFGARHEPLNDGSDRIDVSPSENKVRSRLRKVPYFGEPVGWHIVRPWAGGSRLEASIISVVIAIATVQSIHWLNRFGLRPLKSGLVRLRESIEGGLSLLRELTARHPDLSGFARTDAMEVLLSKIRLSLVEADAALPSEIPLPEDSRMILIGFFLLLCGTAIYRIFAPDSVKEYTETGWVAELGRPRLLYVREKFTCGPRWRFYLLFQCVSYVLSVSGLSLLVWVFLTNFWAALALVWRDFSM